MFAVFGYQEFEDQPLLELINGVADSVVPMRPAYSSPRIAQCGRLAGNLRVSPICTAPARPWLVTITLQIRMFGARPSRKTFLGRGETRVGDECEGLPQGVCLYVWWPVPRVVSGTRRAVLGYVRESTGCRRMKRHGDCGARGWLGCFVSFP